jgi:hypothetical protein
MPQGRHKLMKRMKEMKQFNTTRGESADDKLLRKQEVAAMLACSPRTVDRLASIGHLTRVKVLGGVRFRGAKFSLS